LLDFLDVMISKLPRWIWTGAWILAFMAGIINVVGLLGFEHQAITHLTGTTSMLATQLALGQGWGSLHFAAMLASFLAGTVLSGFLIQDGTLQMGHRYGVALFLEAILLSVAIPFLQRHQGWGLYLASCACGLQNAMITTYSGAVVRTTHVSGMFTDLGIFLGHALRGLSIDRRRLRLSFLIISAFLCGGIAGTLVFQWIGYFTLIVPATLAALMAGGYEFYLFERKR
jgi:uncharacterized membrane protein YoaK (UPF0700 family)